MRQRQWVRRQRRVLCRHDLVISMLVVSPVALQAQNVSTFADVKARAGGLAPPTREDQRTRSLSSASKLMLVPEDSLIKEIGHVASLPTGLLKPTPSPPRISPEICRGWERGPMPVAGWGTGRLEVIMTQLPKGSRIGVTQARQAISSAMAGWDLSALDLRLQWSADGLLETEHGSAIQLDPRPGQIVIRWFSSTHKHRLGEADRLGLAMVRTLPETGEGVWAEIFLPADRSVLVLQATMTHELGHVLGLDHRTELGSTMREDVPPKLGITPSAHDLCAVWGSQIAWRRKHGYTGEYR